MQDFVLLYGSFWYRSLFYFLCWLGSWYYHQTFPLVYFLLFSNILAASGKRKLLSFNFHQVQENMVFQRESLILDLTNVHLGLINLSSIAFSGKIPFSFPKELVFQINRYIRVRKNLKFFLMQFVRLLWLLLIKCASKRKV